MKSFLYIVGLCWLGSLFSCSTNQPSTRPLFDKVIYNARILDGSGEKPYHGYVGIIDDSIAVVASGDPDPGMATDSLDAGNKLLTPGFIDLHAHGNPLKTPDFKNFLSMGVTTIGLGQDGSSPSVDLLDSLSKVFAQGGLGTNSFMFYGHGTLRHEAGVNSEPVPSSQQMDRMDSLIQVAMKYSFGLSLGLEYIPGLYSSEAELKHLAGEVGQSQRMIMSHIRNEDDPVLKESINEMLLLGKVCKVHISHLKSVYGSGAERALEILAWLHEARSEGVEVSADIYPYTASYTGISILFPEWAKTEQQLNDILKSRRGELETFLYEKVMYRNGPEATLIGTGEYSGLTLAEAAEREGISFVKLLIDHIGPQGASGAYFVMNEELQTELLKDPLIGICSDGSPTGYHPRGHGSFARIIQKYVLKEQILTLDQAVYKMTGFAADLLAVQDRGFIRAGMKADLIVFDPGDVREKASYENPLQRAEGFDYVMVNGTWVRYNGKFTEALPGRYLVPHSLPEP